MNEPRTVDQEDPASEGCLSMKESTTCVSAHTLAED